MKIHEYQAKALFAERGIPIPRGHVATTPAEARAVAEDLAATVVVKAQVHVGGRGKAGGVKLAHNADEAEAAAAQILGMSIKGLTVERVLVEEACDIAQEFYLGIVVDRAARMNAIMASAAGGVDIEEVAATTPEKIVKVHIDPMLGLLDFQARAVAKSVGLSGKPARQFAQILQNLYKCYIELDASLAEINPLVVTGDGTVIAADAKVNIDDNALFRQPRMEEFREEVEEDPIEAEAHSRGLPYVRLSGDIGVIGNGAGLVMTTLDMVQRAGGRPANFLDIGGGAKAEVVVSALEVVLMDKAVKGVIFNIFGGITRCDEVAKGVLQAVKQMDIKIPLAIRLTGTRDEEGRALLEGSSLVAAETMAEAAEIIVALTRDAN